MGMAALRPDISLSTVFLVYLTAVLALTTWGGVAVGVVAAVAASGLENYFFVRPFHTLAVARPDDVVAIIAFLVFAVGSSLIVNGFARRSTMPCARAPRRRFSRRLSPLWRRVETT